MLAKIIIGIAFIFMSFTALAQNTGSIKGKVIDAEHKYDLQLATISILNSKDSSLVNYQITNDQGLFNIGNLPLHKAMIVSISFSGYFSIHKSIELDTTQRDIDYGNLLLIRDTARLMEEVIIQAVAPVTMNGDTLEINPKAFKLASYAVVEDMLLRVPGITMWSDGKITVNGKEVNKVYVDGKPFFGGSPEMATQNLPKNAIDKIQVYQEKDFTKDDITNSNLDSLLTMNIKLQADKRKGFFGKIGAGIGTDKRYESDITLQGFNSKTRVGIVGNINNTNKAIDNVGEAMRGNTFRSFNKRNFVASDGNMDGLNKVSYVGATIEHSFIEATNTRLTNAINGGYDLKTSNNSSITDRLSIQNLNNYSISTKSNQSTESNGLNQSLKAGYRYNKAAREFSLSADYKWSNRNAISENTSTAFKNNNVLMNRGSNKNNTQSNNQSVSINGNFNNNDNDEGVNKKSFSTNYSLSYSKNESDSRRISTFESLIDSLYTDSFDRKYLNESSSLNTSLNINYNGLRSLLFGSYNFWGINIGLKNNLSVNKSELNASVFDIDSLTNQYIENKDLSNLNELLNVDNSPGISFFKSINRQLSDRFRRNISFRTNLQNQLLYQKNTSTLSYRNIERTMYFFRPSASVDYSYDKFNKYEWKANISFNTGASAPSIDQLYPIIDSINRYNMIVGNPNLKSSSNNKFNFSTEYNSKQFNQKNTYSAGLNLGYTLTNNAVGDSSIYDDAGGRTSYYINIAQRKSFNGNLRLSSSFKINKNNLQISYTSGFNNSESPQYINQIRSTSKNNSFNNNINLFFGYLDIFNISIGQSISSNKSIQFNKLNKSSSLRSDLYSTNGQLNITLKKDITFTTTLNYLNNKAGNNQTNEATIWNAYATYRFLKGKQAEVKFSVFDLLRQNKNIVNTVNANSSTTSIANGLTQYYMISLSYFPRRFGGKQSRSGEGRRERSEFRNADRPSMDGGGRMRGMRGGE